MYMYVTIVVLQIYMYVKVEILKINVDMLMISYIIQNSVRLWYISTCIESTIALPINN